MKANRKFTRANDDAVSPVIAVILMVAITVVLAATVYVWVSGFGAASNQPARSIALDSNGPTSSTFQKEFTITSASTGLKWVDLRITLDGQLLTFDSAASACTDTIAQGDFIRCGISSGTLGIESESMTVDGGDAIRLYATPGQTLRILDAQANSVLLTVMVG